jgi:hypothetical protein
MPGLCCCRSSSASSTPGNGAWADRAPPRGERHDCARRLGAGGGRGDCGPGGDLLFRTLRCSTIGAEGFHGRVRDGIGCLAPRHGHQAGKACPGPPARRGGRSGGLSCDGREVSVRPRVRALPLHAGGVGSRPIERLVPVSWHGLLRFHLRPIDVVVFHGSRRDLVLRRVSRLDAFSGYPVRT